MTLWKATIIGVLVLFFSMEHCEAKEYAFAPEVKRGEYCAGNTCDYDYLVRQETNKRLIEGSKCQDANKKAKKLGYLVLKDCWN